jgi:integrase
MPRKRKLPEGMAQRGEHYYCDFYAGGQRIRQKLATDLGAAKQILIELRSRAQKGDFGLLDNDYPLVDLKEQYLRHAEQALNELSVVRYKHSLDTIIPALAVARVNQVSIGLVLTYRAERTAAGRAPSTVNAEVRSLHRMLRWGVKHKIIASSPLDGVPALPNLRPKDGRALTPGEVASLLDASPTHWREPFYCYLVTGMRLRELIRLTFDDIDWEGRELIVRAHKAKGKRERRIPIDDGLWDILKRLSDERPARKPSTRIRFGRPQRERFSTRHVFVTRDMTPISTTGVWNALLRLRDKAGIETHTLDGEGLPLEHVDVHSLRRTFATELIVNGADPKSVQELLGHRTLTMTMKLYAKVRGQNKFAAVAKLPYGKGVSTPAHVIGYATGPTISVRDGHQSVTSREEAS